MQTLLQLLTPTPPPHCLSVAVTFCLTVSQNNEADDGGIQYQAWKCPDVKHPKHWLHLKWKCHNFTSNKNHVIQWWCLNKFVVAEGNLFRTSASVVWLCTTYKHRESLFWRSWHTFSAFAQTQSEDRLLSWFKKKNGYLVLLTHAGLSAYKLF